jgi:hypothetical protein
MPTHDVFDAMIEKWPSPIVTRQEVKTLTGGLISPKTLANLACIGDGPPCEALGGKKVYRIETFVPWLREWATKGRSR